MGRMSKGPKPQVAPHCRPWLFDRTLLQFGQVNSLAKLHSSSLSVPAGAGGPTNPTAELRRGTESHVLVLTQVEPRYIHQGLFQMQRPKSPMGNAADTMIQWAGEGELWFCSRSMLNLREWISSKASAMCPQPWLPCPKAQGRIRSHKPTG